MSDRPLPDPDEHPDLATVIWDGKCQFCRRQVERLRAIDGGRLTYIDLHDPRVAERYPQLSYEQLMEQMWLITPAGEAYGGADAMRALSRRLPLLWPLAPLMHLPGMMPCWRRAYRWIAQRRYRLAACDEGTCKLHRSDAR
ncbi:MAG: thiol-disulfide oxidoreductase [Pirellulaceae bacterium]|nr:MAG: thiol-disulfide oxidoreductase [Pirellulaceae bacterium]